jgi:arylsulfatase A
MNLFIQNLRIGGMIVSTLLSGSMALASPFHPAKRIIEKPTIDRPNVILIMADDLGAGMLGCNGQKIVTTPHIDQLAAEGMSFSQYYTNTYCAPSRWSLITGMHNGRRGSGSHDSGGKITALEDAARASGGSVTQAQWDSFFSKYRKKSDKIPPREMFLAQIAQNAGYHTAQFGKLDIGFLTWPKLLERHGWDHYVGYLDHQRAHGFFPSFLWKNGKPLPLKGNSKTKAGKGREDGLNPVGSLGTTYSQDVFNQEILKYIKTHRNERFFLYHPTQLPHGPTAVKRIHPDFAHRNDLTLSEKKYATMVKSLDDTVGMIMAELKKWDLDKKTIIFFCSDNGHETYYINAKGRRPKNQNRAYQHADGSKANITDSKWRTSIDGDIFNGAGGRAGLKWHILQGGIHCPLIVRWPGKIKPSSRTDLLCTIYDFMPTLAEITGSKPPLGKDGISYLSTLLGQPKAQKRHDWIFIAGGTRPLKNALITRDGWKLIGLKDGGYQLYNVFKDPGEYNNLENKFPERVKSLAPLFKQQLHSAHPKIKTSKL